jgi:hypothetical protein
MKKGTFLACFLIFTGTSLVCQNSVATDSREVPPAPVISSLSAVCSGSKVTLTWTAAPDVEGVNIILRSTRPVTAANYGSAESRATISVSETTWTDTLPDQSEYYYAVMTRDVDGTLYDFFLPASNSLLVPVKADAIIATVTTAFTTFDAMTRNDAIIITWNSSVPEKNLVLYRSTSPFTDMTSLVQAVVVSTFKDDGAPYVDYPVPGVPYYYTILDEDAIRSGSATFTDALNTNRIPVEIPSMYVKIQRAKLPVLRSMPLPWLNPSSAAEIPALRFSAETEKKITELVTKSVSMSRKETKPFIFEMDKDVRASGEAYTLQTLLSGNFSNGKWAEAIADFSAFLAIRRTEETADRTHFYLGEAQYFNGAYDAALLEFLLAEDRYYNQSKEWIERVLSEMIR